MQRKTSVNWRFVAVFAMMAIGYPIMLYSFFFGMVKLFDNGHEVFPVIEFKSELFKLGFFGGGAIGAIGLLLMLENFGTFGSFIYKREEGT